MAILEEPEALFAVNAGAVAKPALLVVVVTKGCEFAKAPLGPVFGAINVTETFGTWFPRKSVTPLRLRDLNPAHKSSQNVRVGEGPSVTQSK